MIGERYASLSIVLHWVHAIIFLFLVSWGWWMVDLPKGSERGFAISVHKSIGMVAFLVLLVRVVWRFTHKSPQEVIVPFYAEKLSKIVHVCLYLLLFVVPIMGYMSASFTKYDMRFFGLPLPKVGWLDPEINELFSQVHGILAWTLVALVVVHIVGAVIHPNSIKRISL